MILSIYQVNINELIGSITIALYLYIHNASSGVEYV